VEAQKCSKSETSFSILFTFGNSSKLIPSPVPDHLKGPVSPLLLHSLGISQIFMADLHFLFLLGSIMKKWGWDKGVPEKIHREEEM